jgi:hypothetical protein
VAGARGTKLAMLWQCEASDRADAPAQGEHEAACIARMRDPGVLSGGAVKCFRRMI